MQYSTYISDTPVTLKQGESHQTKNDNVDPKQGYNYAKFERSCFNGVREKHNIIFFVSNQEICKLSPLDMCYHQKRWYIYELLEILNNPMKCQLNQIRT